MSANCLLLVCLFFWYKYQLQHRAQGSKANILCLMTLICSGRDSELIEHSPGQQHHTICCTCGQNKEDEEINFFISLLLNSHSFGQGCCSSKPPSPVCVCEQVLLLPTSKSHVCQNVQVLSVWYHINEKLCLVPSLRSNWSSPESHQEHCQWE